MDFIKTDLPEFHISRRKEILQKYPEIKDLFGNNPMSLFWIIICVLAQITISFALKDESLLSIFCFAYIFGAFLSHALYVFVHESAHNLVLKTTFANRLVGIFCDFGLAMPGAMAFRKYHLSHHRQMGEYDYDADIPTRGEAKCVGNNAFKKALWMLFFGLSQAMRPMRLKKMNLMDKWVRANLIAQIIVVSAIVFFFGWKSILYIALSTLFGLGLHPLGGRWIAEHFIGVDVSKSSAPHQETFSYYGPVNKIMFNIGYHNEHHDVMTVPWNRLPKIKKIAPDYYEGLASYSSYTKLLLKFIFDKKMSGFTRIIR